jgi:ribose-phosphate pyrophosphokinase
VKPLLAAFPGNEALSARLAGALDAESIPLTVRRFPDEESYVRFESAIAGRNLILLCTLDRPDSKFLPLAFAAQTAKELGAARVGLIAPYLAYMRQDKRFHRGEAVSAEIFAAEISRPFDWLVTVDPHLHRLKSLGAVYKIPARAVHAAPLIADFIKREVAQPLLIGPDAESAQWARSTAEAIGAPSIVLEKIRRGDRDVSVRVPDVERWRDRTPVLVDDIISTGQTMIETIGHLHEAGLRPPVCIAVHGVFATGSYEGLRKAGVARIVTANTIAHETNGIDAVPLLAESARALMG